MYRVVFDPGVLLSGLISPEGTPARLLLAWVRGDFEIVASPHLLEELRRVLGREKFRKYVTAEDVEEFLSLIERFAIQKEDVPRPAPLTEDRKDDYLVALARVSRADFLVSGDAHLLDLEDARPPVLDPRSFYDKLATMPG